MVRKLAALLGVVVLQVNDLFNQILRLAFNNEGWRRWLVMVQEHIGVLRLQLGDMEHQQKIVKLWELWRAPEYSRALQSSQSLIFFTDEDRVNVNGGG